MKVETLKALKIRVFKREMEKNGYPVKFHKEKDIEKMAMSVFKGMDGKQVRSFGAELTEDEDGNVVITKVKGEIRKRQRAQIESFQMNDQTFGQQIAAENIKQYYGYDVFDFIKSRGIEIFNLSNGEYVDPETGDIKTFVGVI